MRVFNKHWKRLIAKRLLVKNKKKLKVSILHQLRIKQIYDEDFIFQRNSTCSYQLQLDAYYVLLHPKLKTKLYTHWNHNCFEKYMVNGTIFLFCSIIIPQLLPSSFKSELPFLPGSEMGNFHTLVLNFKNWPFSVIVKRHFRSKPGHLNQRVCCKPIETTLKMLFIEGPDSFLQTPIPKLRKLLVFGLKKRT